MKMATGWHKSRLLMSNSRPVKSINLGKGRSSQKPKGGGAGRYKIQTQVRDDVSDKISDIDTSYVELVEPLTDDEVSIEYTGPKCVITA